MVIRRDKLKTIKYVIKNKVKSVISKSKNGLDKYDVKLINHILGKK